MLMAIRQDLARGFRRAALPLSCYYALTLLVPLLNGAAESEAFAGHAVVVATVPLVLVLLMSALDGGIRRLAGAVPLRHAVPLRMSAVRKAERARRETVEVEWPFGLTDKTGP